MFYSLWRHPMVWLPICLGPSKDEGMMRLSWAKVALKNQLRQFNQANGDPFVVYGDPAYSLSRNIISPFRGARLTQQEQEFNTRMSAVRSSVEWGFGKITQYFAYLDFRKNLKVLLQPVGKYYLVGTLLVNCHTCLYGSQTSTYFNLPPPSLETYLSNQWHHCFFHQLK